MRWQEKDGYIWVEAGSLASQQGEAPRRIVLSPSELSGWKNQDDLGIFVVGDSRGLPLVLSESCTHAGCPVDWKDGRFLCPCHGSSFDREGRVLTGPATRPLDRPQVLVEGESLWVQVKARK